jgi:hypothetical protein
MDFYYKLLQDNKIQDANQLPYSGQQFTYDDTLVVDTVVNRTTTLNNVKYATSFLTNGSTYYVTLNDTTTPIPSNLPQQPAIPTNTYTKVSATTYVSASDSGETVITLSELAGCDIVQIEKNIQPLQGSEFTWNKSTFTLTLVDEITTGQKLFIIYSQII